MKRSICMLLVCLFSLLLISACTSNADGDTANADGDSSNTDGDEEGESDLPAGTVELNGSVEKGPFVLGSSITISPVDGQGNPTGQQFTTQTINDLGEFSVNFKASGFVSLEGSGFYYNEVTGDLSKANLTLRAFYEITNTGAQNAHLNLLTHLTYNRVKNLIQAGEKFADAITKAEKELVDALPIGSTNFTLADKAIELTLQGGDTIENAYLFAVSSVIGQAARLRSPGSPDAALQEIINGISADLATDGKISQTMIKSLTEAQALPRELSSTGEDKAKYLLPNVVMADLEKRFSDLGSTATVPDLNKVLDSDFDSHANADDNCWWIANINQEDANKNDIGDACDIIFEDKSTGLMWQNPSMYHENNQPKFLLTEQPAGAPLPADILSYCDDLDLGGFTDWRVPSISALRTLVDGCPVQAFGGSCPIGNNGCPSGTCQTECPACSAKDTPYWKDGLIGPTVMLSSSLGYKMDFVTASFFDIVNGDEKHARCVRGYMSSYELVCDDTEDDDQDGKKNCDDEDCFGRVADRGSCNNNDDLRGLASVNFLASCIGIEAHVTCTNTISVQCAECYNQCIGQKCRSKCQENGDSVSAECEQCMQTNCSTPSDCFGDFICEPEFHCQDNIDNDSDGKTDMDDPDCQAFTGTVDGDVDTDSTDNSDTDTALASPVVNGNSVTFNFMPTGDDPSMVRIMGGFEGTVWYPTTSGMVMEKQGKLWTKTVSDLACGKYTYKFYVMPGAKWLTDPLNSENTGDPEYLSVFNITSNCATDGDEEIEIDTECLEGCASFVGNYCTNSIIKADESCTNYFNSTDSNVVITEVNSTSCSYKIATMGDKPKTLLEESEGCNFANVDVGDFGAGDCTLLSDSEEGTLMFRCKSGACIVEMNKAACIVVDGDEEMETETTEIEEADTTEVEEADTTDVTEAEESDVIEVEIDK